MLSNRIFIVCVVVIGIGGCSEQVSYSEIKVRKDEKPVEAAEKTLNSRGEIEKSLLRAAKHIYLEQKISDDRQVFYLCTQIRDYNDKTTGKSIQKIADDFLRSPVAVYLNDKDVEFIKRIPTYIEEQKKQIRTDKKIGDVEFEEFEEVLFYSKQILNAIEEFIKRDGDKFVDLFVDKLWSTLDQRSIKKYIEDKSGLPAETRSAFLAAARYAADETKMEETLGRSLGSDNKYELDMPLKQRVASTFIRTEAAYGFIGMQNAWIDNLGFNSCLGSNLKSFQDKYKSMISSRIIRKLTPVANDIQK